MTTFIVFLSLAALPIVLVGYLIYGLRRLYYRHWVGFDIYDEEAGLEAEKLLAEYRKDNLSKL